MAATGPATLISLQAMQSLIVSVLGAQFAALSVVDQARYGVARAVFIGTPKTTLPQYLPQCTITPVDDDLTITGAAGRIEDEMTVDVRIIVSYADWWVAEQALLSLRDSVTSTLLPRLRSGAAAGGVLTSLSEHGVAHGVHKIERIAEQFVRVWTFPLLLRQTYVPVAGLQP